MNIILTDYSDNHNEKVAEPRTILNITGPETITRQRPFSELVARDEKIVLFLGNFFIEELEKMSKQEKDFRSTELVLSENIAKIITEQLDEHQVVQTLGAIPRGYKSWTIAFWKIVCFLLNRIPRKIDILDIKNWNRILITEHRKIVENQGFIPSNIKFQNLDVPVPVGELPSQYISQPIPRLNCFHPFENCNSFSPLKGVIFNEFLCWLDLPIGRQSNPTLLVGVSTYLRKSQTIIDNIIMDAETDTISVTVLGIFNTTSQSTKLPLDQVDSYAQFKCHNTTFNQVWEDWKSSVESRAHSKKARSNKMTAMHLKKQRGECTESLNKQRQRIYRKHGCFSQFMNLLNGPALFKKYGLDCVFFSVAPNTPTNILNQTEMLDAKLPDDYNADINLPLPPKKEFVSIRSKIESTIIWLVPRVDRNKRTATGSFITYKTQNNINNEVGRRQTRHFQKSKSGKECQIIQCQDAIQSSCYSNVMSAILITGKSDNPIQEFLIPNHMHFATRNHTAQLGQPMYKMIPIKNNSSCKQIFKNHTNPSHHRIQFLFNKITDLEDITASSMASSLKQTTWVDSSGVNAFLYGISHGPVMSRINSEPALESMAAVALAGTAILQLVNNNLGKEIGRNAISPLSFVLIFDSSNLIEASQNAKHSLLHHRPPIYHSRSRVHKQSQLDYRSNQVQRVINQLDTKAKILGPRETNMRPDSLMKLSGLDKQHNCT